MKARVVGLACAALLGTAPACAFKLQALGPSPQESVSSVSNRQALGFMLHFTSDVHERITRQAYERAGVKLTEDVMNGVRWNDNPPALRIGAIFGSCSAPGSGLAEGLECWTSTLRFDRFAWETVTRREKGIAPLRSHFGDMQFLHAMASASGETAAETRTKVLRWSEFAWRVARGEIAPRANVYGLRRNPGPLEPATAEWVAGLFAAAEKRLWRVQDVFLSRPGNLREVAFGSLLHTVEDSYSAAHVRRATSRVQPNGCLSYDAADAIAQFHTYVGQDTEKHGLCDDAPDWLGSPRDASPTDALAQLVRAFDEGRDWAVVKAILADTVFRLADPAAVARPGACFEMHADAVASDAAITPGPTMLEASCREEMPR